MPKLAIIGAGGHGKVVADSALKSGKYHEIVFLDSRYPTMETLLDLPVVGDDSMVLKLISDEFEFVVAIGDNSIRQRIFSELTNQRADIATVVHPSSQLAHGVKIESGSVVFANATINADTIIGHNVIVNTGAIIEHDCVVENHVHCGPNSTVMGGAKVGDSTLIGASATVIPNKTIGKRSVIGVGAVVVKDIPDNTVAAGIPASW